MSSKIMQETTPILKHRSTTTSTKSFEAIDNALAVMIRDRHSSSLSPTERQSFHRIQERVASVYLTPQDKFVSRPGLPMLPLLQYLALKESSLDSEDVNELKDLSLLLEQVISSAESRINSSNNKNGSNLESSSSSDSGGKKVSFATQTK